MKKNYKILVLSDLNKSTSNTLKSSITLAKIVNAEINFFHVKSPSDVVDTENQLSAMRSINQNYIITNNKITKLINSISTAYNVNVNHTFTTGNVKNEIEKHIQENKPDIIVLGKRKSKLINFIGDNITQFVLKKYKGVIVIAHDNRVLEPNKELGLGLFNNTITNDGFLQEIIQSTKKPLSYFKIVENVSTSNDVKVLNINKSEYTFVKGTNVIKNVSNYLTKSNVNLLCISRKNSISGSTKTNLNDLINKLDCSLILTS
jgi:nucleotide-binding universal stress UspA family protein